jgi:sugar phosphate isomerase/epimerase
MNHRTHRRSFLQTSASFGVGMSLTALGMPQRACAWQIRGAPNAEKLGWRLGVQAWTFRLFTLFEAIDKTAALGLKYLETFVGQPISKEHLAVKFRADMPTKFRTLVQRKLADSGITLTSHYEVGPYREMLEFCKEMGMEMLISDPPPGAFGCDFATVDKLCEEYGITLALTNHPKPAPYSNPESVLAACHGRSKRIGASGDIGHWMREGLNPLECVKKLESRLLHFHFRDRNQFGGSGHDVPLGTGIADVRGILTELHRKGSLISRSPMNRSAGRKPANAAGTGGFAAESGSLAASESIKPLFMLEYEYHEANSLPEVAQSVKFFNDVAGALLLGK